MKTVFVSGCFDVLHPGHKYFLHAASKFGDRLVVGLNSDSSVRKLKGPQRPIYSQDERKRDLEQLTYVDEVILFCENNPIDLIKSLKPQVLAKGWDQNLEGVEEVLMLGGILVKIPKYRDFSTSSMVGGE